jgi:hypothetical protein
VCVGGGALVMNARCIVVISCADGAGGAATGGLTDRWVTNSGDKHCTTVILAICGVVLEHSSRYCCALRPPVLLLSLLPNKGEGADTVLAGVMRDLHRPLQRLFSCSHSLSASVIQLHACPMLLPPRHCFMPTSRQVKAPTLSLLV